MILIVLMMCVKVVVETCTECIRDFAYLDSFRNWAQIYSNNTFIASVLWSLIL